MIQEWNCTKISNGGVLNTMRFARDVFQCLKYENNFFNCQHLKNLIFYVENLYNFKKNSKKTSKYFENDNSDVVDHFVENQFVCSINSVVSVVLKFDSHFLLDDLFLSEHQQYPEIINLLKSIHR